MKFSEHLRKQVDSIWNASFEHPFVTGVADGSLSLDAFKHYVKQDSYYLSKFAQVQSIGAAKALDFYTTSRMAFHAKSTFDAEHMLHEGFAKELGLSEEGHITVENPAPTAVAYTNHLFASAYKGTLGDVIAAILPCYWLYWEIGEKFKGAKPGVAIYQKWIDTYGDEWFGDLVQEQINRLDDWASKASDGEKKRMEEIFVTSSKYEYMFWEMAYTLEEWPV
ncbi:thiaminase II [Halalkalibacter hemicellulosilyticus]|uniref:Aminopyrimidine aminohydrolase n=1 Tax=Halalkalibacter hemicellulosilyticusJCM 9152 TaxID=1236971 RepID=W4QFY8_9BACI|nr:thiaminase II [Halalkalibacter hemicellulosilyticus]GAE30563.1 thiaminase II [Halalkalibacter hemicellulosilyticusJCM 9152]